MVILQANGIKKSYGVKTVLDFEHFAVYEGDKIGVVGRNGAGKSTLLGILAGEIPPDEGSVQRQVRPAFVRQITQKTTGLSGGERQKQQIRSETTDGRCILFADEPTANLDQSGIQWIQSKLQAATTLLLVSHDRELLDAVCTRIVEVEDGKLNHYTGNYSDYLRAVEQQRSRQEQQHLEYKRKKNQLERAVQKKETKIQSIHHRHKARQMKNNSEERLRGDKLAASFQKIEREKLVYSRRLASLEKVDRVREAPKITLDFSLTNPPGNKFVITCEGLTFSYGDKPVFRDAKFQIPNRKKIAITGNNGSGKSTLLHLITEGHPDIRLAPKLRCGVLYQSFDSLDPARSILDNVLLTSVQDHASVRSVLAGLLFRGDDVYKSVKVLSGGEKMRLQIAKLITSGNNALLLDEPTNFLDLASIQAVREVLLQYPGTLLVVSHDRRFLEEVTEMELRVAEGGVTPVDLRQAAPSPVEKTLLEVRMMKLLGEMSGADPQYRHRLEQEYAEAARQLSQLQP